MKVPCNWLMLREHFDHLLAQWLYLCSTHRIQVVDVDVTRT